MSGVLAAGKVDLSAMYVLYLIYNAYLIGIQANQTSLLSNTTGVLHPTTRATLSLVAILQAPATGIPVAVTDQALCSPLMDY